MDITAFLTTLIGAGIGTACVNYAFNKRIKAIEKESLWQTKLFDDVYSAHKSLWEDVRELTVPTYFSYRRDGTDSISTYIMYFLRSLNETNNLIISFRIKFSKYSIFLEKSINIEAEYIQQYMDSFHRLLVIRSFTVDQKEINNYEWIAIAEEYSKMFEDEVLPSIRKLQILTESYLRKNILEHEWIDLTDKERQKKDQIIKTRLGKTQLFSKINKEPLFIK